MFLFSSYLFRPGSKILTNVSSPSGGASQSSDGAKSMADRELPQLPPTQDAEENDHDYDILDDQKLAYHAALTPPSVTRMVDYDTIENLQMGLTQSQYCTPTRGGCLGSWGALTLRLTIPLSALFSGYSVSLACLYNYSA